MPAGTGDPRKGAHTLPFPPQSFTLPSTDLALSSALHVLAHMQS